MYVRSSIASVFLLVSSLTACSGGKVAGSSKPDDASMGDAYLAPLTTNGLTLTSETFSGGGGNLKFVNVMPPAAGSCTLQRQGNCLVQDCRGSAGALQGVSAGEVDLNDGATTVLKVLPGAPAMLYAEDDSPTAPWQQGDGLQFVAAGASVPQFDLTLTAPGPVAVTRPLMTPGMPLSIDPTVDLVVAWQPTGDGVTVELLQASSPGDLASSLRVLCEFQGGPGRALVPTSMLHLFGTDTSLSNTINIGGSSSLDTTLGGYWVHASALNMQTTTFTLP
jgi:hypothetical protein